AFATTLGTTSAGPDDNFFDLGGDSIRSIRVRAAARARGLSFSIEQLFRTPRIADLAELAELTVAPDDREASIPRFALVDVADRRARPSGVEDAYPIARLQHGMLFHGAYEPGAATYHDVVGYRLAGAFDAMRLQACLDALVREHAVLRTSFDLQAY